MRICSICAPIFILAPRYNINKKPHLIIKSGWSSNTIKANSGFIQYIHHTPTASWSEFFTPPLARFEGCLIPTPGIPQRIRIIMIKISKRNV